MPFKVCLVLSGSTLKENLVIWAKFSPWSDMAELRADRLDRDQWDLLSRFKGDFPKETIITLRRPEDGGGWDGPESERVEFFKMRLQENWAFWDIEEDHPLSPELEDDYRRTGGVIVRSFHDFQGVPDNWSSRVARIMEAGDIAKAAMMVRGSKDLEEIFRKSKELPPGKRVILGMGDFGTPTRILGTVLGSLWTYASPPLSIAAPGQLDPATLKERYRVHLWKPSDPIYGIVGNPLVQSRSPEIHNLGLNRLGLPGVYLPFLSDNWETFSSLARLLGINGLSVTIPFKEKAAALADYKSDGVQACGSCNTLKFQEGSWMGSNTDVPGFLEPLLRKLDLKSLKGKTASVIGTGGAARAVLYALKNAGAEVLVLGRTPEKARIIAETFDCDWAELKPESTIQVFKHNEIIVQAGSAGMGDQEGVDPLKWYNYNGSETVYDLVYKPRVTAFLKHAESSGCKVIYGWEMFAEQAKLQFLTFTGQTYPEPFPLA